MMQMRLLDPGWNDTGGDLLARPKFRVESRVRQEATAANPYSSVAALTDGIFACWQDAQAALHEF